MTKKQLGEFINAERNKQDLSQTELANKIERRRQSVFEVEKDLVDYRVSVLLALISALGYTIELVQIQKSFEYDFSKIKIPLADPISPFKKIKKHEKNNRRFSK